MWSPNLRHRAKTRHQPNTFVIHFLGGLQPTTLRTLSHLMKVIPIYHQTTQHPILSIFQNPSHPSSIVPLDAQGVLRIILPLDAQGGIKGGLDPLRRFALHSIARPLWMDVPSPEVPAFAGMTEVMHSTRRGDPCGRPTTRTTQQTILVHPPRQHLLQNHHPCDIIEITTLMYQQIGWEGRNNGEK